MKNISLIGCTGSIGRQAIEVCLAATDKFRIVAMAAESSFALFEEQINKVKPRYCALADSVAAERVTEVPAGTKFCSGEEAALAVASYKDADIVLVAAGGFAGLKYSLAAINAGKTLALANKETLVCGGDFVMPLARKKGADILPVDSEHSAIWQCLGFNCAAPFKRLIITASGGAFRGYTAKQLSNVTPSQALSHPTWNMGAKITIDSATLLNKGFEVIEAHHLFGAEYSAITAVIHPQSIVHSMVEFNDGACLAQLSVPTMKVPIQMAFAYPERLDCGVRPLDFSSALSLEFFPLERGVYPCFDMAADCAAAGGIMPCALNAAGEEAVKAFLSGALPFTGIACVIDGVLQKTENFQSDCYAAAEGADLLARERARALIAAL